MYASLIHTKACHGRDVTWAVDRLDTLLYYNFADMPIDMLLKLKKLDDPFATTCHGWEEAGAALARAMHRTFWSEQRQAWYDSALALPDYTLEIRFLDSRLGSELIARHHTRIFLEELGLTVDVIPAA